MSVLGQEFRSGVVVCLKAPSNECFPKFGQVIHVLVPDEMKLLLVKLFDTESYSQHHNAYCVNMTSDYSIISVDKLALHDVFCLYKLASITLIVVRSCCHTDLFI